MKVEQKGFSSELEKGYYSQNWPGEAKPYLHLERYVRCWLDPEATFSGKRVLDIGAGECTYTRLIAEKFWPKKIVACELFRERMLPAARANRNGHLKFVAGDVFHIPFQSRSFEVIFGSLILCQLPDLVELVREIQRVLVDDGCYIGIEPNPHHPVHLYRYLRGNHSPNQYLLGPRHLSAFEKAGFNVNIQYFWAKFPNLRSSLIGTCMGIIAKRREE